MIRTLEGRIIPLHIRNCLAYMDQNKPMKHEFETLTKVIMTEDGNWDPSRLDNEIDLNDYTDLTKLPDDTQEDEFDPRILDTGEFVDPDPNRQAIWENSKENESHNDYVQHIIAKTETTDTEDDTSFDFNPNNLFTQCYMSDMMSYQYQSGILNTESPLNIDDTIDHLAIYSAGYDIQWHETQWRQEAREQEMYAVRTRSQKNGETDKQVEIPHGETAATPTDANNNDDEINIPVKRATIKHKEPDYEVLRPRFGWLPVNVIKKTFEKTTQFGRNALRLPFRQHFKSRFPALNVRRRSEPVATETFFADTQTIDNGATQAQIFVGRRTLVTDIVPLKAQGDFARALEDNIIKRGAMDVLISDGAKSEISNKVKDILRMYLAPTRANPNINIRTLQKIALVKQKH